MVHCFFFLNVIFIYLTYIYLHLPSTILSVFYIYILQKQKNLGLKAERNLPLHAMHDPWLIFSGTGWTGVDGGFGCVCVCVCVGRDDLGWMEGWPSTAFTNHWCDIVTHCVLIDRGDNRLFNTARQVTDVSCTLHNERPLIIPDGTTSTHLGSSKMTN